MVGLREAGKVKLPIQEFDNEQVRYEHRFLPFSVVMTPPPVHYDQFLSMTDLSNFPQVGHAVGHDCFSKGLDCILIFLLFMLFCCCDYCIIVTFESIREFMLSLYVIM